MSNHCNATLKVAGRRCLLARVRNAIRARLDRRMAARAQMVVKTDHQRTRPYLGLRLTDGLSHGDSH